jgi:hypothetical protein
MEARPGHHGRVRPRAGLVVLSSAGPIEYDRVLFFSDAIFAIAIDG